MSNQETVKGIREQLKAIKEAITGIEFRLSQLESESQAPAAEASSSSRRSSRLELRRGRCSSEDETEQPLDPRTSHSNGIGALSARLRTLRLDKDDQG